MPARILDGNALAARVRAELAAKVAALQARGVVPCLAVVLVGADPASAVYVRNKVRACEAAGMRSLRYEYPAEVDPAEVYARIAALNADTSVHGILVQLPLPEQFDPQRVLQAILPAKDVDGFHPENVGALVQGRPRFVPCTPAGVMLMLESEGVPLKGCEAVVVGRSNIVGKPLAFLLLQAGATVTICHSQTRDLAAHTRRADLLVAAVGKPRMIGAGTIKHGAVVIDVGINRGADGRLAGDVDFDAAKEVASLITPVPGGVGPMTITMLLANTLTAAERGGAA